MKRKLNLLCIMLIGTLCFCVGSSVKAETVTDFSNVSFEIIGISDIDHQHPTIKINGVQFSEGSSEGGKLSYLVLISHSSTEFKDVYNISDPFPDTGEFINKTTSGNYIIDAIRKYFAEAGDIYVTIYENSGATYTKATNAIKVERPPYLALSKRFSTYFFDDETNIRLWDIGGLTDNRNVNYKLGKIPTDLLEKLKNNTSTTLNELLTFAKNDTNYNKEGKIKLASEQPTILTNANLVENNYYYVYVELDTENGTYYPVEDVSIYKALKKSNGNLWLCDYNDSGFSLMSNTNTVTVKEEENPNTGVSYSKIIISLMFAIGGTMYFIIKFKNKKSQA